jgi:hypothetical protein
MAAPVVVVDSMPWARHLVWYRCGVNESEPGCLRRVAGNSLRLKMLLVTAPQPVPFATVDLDAGLRVYRLELPASYPFSWLGQ